jgi:predicted anti-sigma-YlaC factor YlaD
MDCEQFGEIVHDLLRSEALDPSVIEDAFAHAESCQDCDALLEGSESLTASLHSLAVVTATEQAPASVEKRLLGKLEWKRAARRPYAYWRSWAPAAVSVAVAAALLISIVVFRHHAPGVSDPGQKISAVASVQSPQQSRALLPVADLPVADNGNTTESFVPLSDAFDASSLEDATVVRVVLSRSAIESFGLPINESGDSQVVADLVLADDGVPQAIHVVSW